MRILKALHAMSDRIAMLRAGAIAIVLAERLGDAAPRGVTDEIADLIAIAIVADRVARIVFGVCAIAGAGEASADAAAAVCILAARRRSARALS